MKRRDFLMTTAVTASGLLVAHAEPKIPHPLRRPHRPASNDGSARTFSKILLVMCDQWRYRMHWPGEPHIPLPSYRRLCERGLEFTQTCIAASACTPSRATIFSGKYGVETGTQLTSGLHVVLGEHETYAGASPDNPRCNLPRHPQVKTLGHHFSEAGFATCYKGKWHLSHADGQWPRGSAEGLDSFGFHGWRPPEGHGKDAFRLGYGADISYVQDAVQVLWDFKNRGTDRWFLVCSLINPHDIGAYPKWAPDIPDMGVLPPTSFQDQLAGKPSCQKEFRRVWVDGTLAARRLFDLRTRKQNSPPNRLWHQYLQFYAHLTQIADAQVGILLDALEQTELDNETLVVFLSDHGEQGGSHGMMQKWYQAYEESIRVPLIFSNPGLKLTGRQTSAPASLIDIAPTLLAMAGIPLPHDKDKLRGQDLSPIIRGEAGSVQDDILFVSDDDIAAVSPYKAWTGPVGQPNRVRALRNGQYKLVRYVSPDNKVEPEYELYDLRRDPSEMLNLARDAANKPILQQMSQRLDRLLLERYQLAPLYT